MRKTLTQKFIVRGEYEQRNAMGGYGSEWQSDEQFETVEAARKFAKKDKKSFNVRIHEVKGNNGADYPLVEQIKK